MTAVDPVKQGELLRQALVDHLRSALSSGRFLRDGKRYRIDIDEPIKQHIPEGSSFDRAESVLRHAGFTLDPRPSPGVPSRSPGSEEEFDVQASLGYGREGGIPCMVSLRPRTPYDYGDVFRVLASCTFIGL